MGGRTRTVRKRPRTACALFLFRHSAWQAADADALRSPECIPVSTRSDPLPGTCRPARNDRVSRRVAAAPFRHHWNTRASKLLQDAPAVASFVQPFVPGLMTDHQVVAMPHWELSDHILTSFQRVSTPTSRSPHPRYICPRIPRSLRFG